MSKLLDAANVYSLTHNNLLYTQHNLPYSQIIDPLDLIGKEIKPLPGDNLGYGIGVILRKLANHVSHKIAALKESF